MEVMTILNTPALGKVVIIGLPLHDWMVGRVGGGHTTNFCFFYTSSNTPFYYWHKLLFLKQHPMSKIEPQMPLASSTISLGLDKSAPMKLYQSEMDR
jgi:hypothetical protein